MDQHKIIIATQNPVKIERWKRALVDISVLTPAETGGYLEIKENSASLLENASLKATTYASERGIAALGEDIGLYIDVLKGLPGIQIKHWGGKYDTELNSKQLIEEVLNALSNKNNTRANYKVAVTVAKPNGETKSVSYQIDGYIDINRANQSPTPSFPLSAIFVADSNKKTWVEMNWQERLNRDAVLISQVNGIVLQML